MSATPLSDLWEQNEPTPRWRRTLDAFRPDAPVERIAALVASAYVVAVVLELAVVLRP